MYLKIEKSERDILNYLLCYILWVELGSELKLEWSLLLHVLAEHLLVQLEPGREPLGVCVLQTKEPDLSQANSFNNLEQKNGIKIQGLNFRSFNPVRDLTFVFVFVNCQGSTYQ